MKYEFKEVRRTFLNRLKTQSRPYKTLNFYFLPKVYISLCKIEKQNQIKLQILFENLFNKIQIPINESTLINILELEYLKAIKNSVFIKIKGKKEEILLQNFVTKNSNLKEISIDHHISFHKIITENIHKLPELLKISNLCQNHSSNEIVSNQNKFNINIDTLMLEINFLFEITELRLLPKHINISKGKN